MTSKDDAYQSLRSAVAALGYPDELAMVLADELRGPNSILRMAAYLRAARPQSMEQIADEMIAIIEQRETWVRKKVSEHAQSSFNEFLNREPEADIQMYYEESGVGEPLLLLHGNGEDSTYFAHQVEFFRERYRVIAPDTRGHGKTPRGTAPFTLGQFACDLVGLMDELGLVSAHILGFSDGGNIALLFALEHPECVRSLVLNGANLFPEGLTAQTRAEIDEEYAEAQAQGDEFQLELLRLMIEEPRIDPNALAKLNMPVLVVAGTDDMIEEAHTRLIAQSIPGARLAFVEGSHFVASENPDAFNQVVSSFLSGNRTERA